MFTQNLHTHSTFDDGQNTLEEMARAAMSAGLTSIGFSVHTPMPFPSCWTIDAAHMPEYIAKVQQVQHALRGQIDVYCGAEWDLYSPIAPTGFDYVIGSIHHRSIGSEVPCVDNSVEETKYILRRGFGGDADAMAEAYFRQYEALARVKEVDIVGHFDLLTKFDEQWTFFDPDSPRFRAAATDAMDLLIAAGKIFEINTGAISRGYRTTPYPSETLLRELFARGAKVTISADAHRTQDVAFGFAQAEALARRCGYREAWQFSKTGFVAVPLDETV